MTKRLRPPGLVRQFEAKYSNGFTDWRKIYGLATPGSANNDINPEYRRPVVSCAYCRNLYTDKATNCRSCGAPRSQD